MATSVPCQVTAQRHDSPLPLRFEDFRLEVVVVDGSAVESLGPDALAAMVSGCAAKLRLGPDDSAAVVRTPVLDVPRIATPPDSAPVSFFVLPRQSYRADCGTPEAQFLIAPTRGIQVVDQFSGVFGPRVTAVAVYRAGRLVQPIDAAVLPLAELSPAGLNRLSFGMARITLAAAAIQAVPADDSVIITLTFSNGHESGVLVPPEILKTLHHRFMSSRLLRAVGRTPQPNAVFAVPDPPRDTGLARGVAAYRARDFVTATRIALRSLDHGRLSRSDVLAARVQLGLTALGHGDTASAQLVLSEAVAAEPCLRLSAAAGEPAQGFLERVAGDASPDDYWLRCKLDPAWEVGLRGALLPGFGRPTTPRRRATGVSIALFSVGFLISGVVQEAAAHDAYWEYVHDPTLTGATAASKYDAAERHRKTALALYRGAAVLWGASFVEALWSNRRAHQHAGRVGAYGSSPEASGQFRLGVTRPLGVPGLGVSVAF